MKAFDWSCKKLFKVANFSRNFPSVKSIGALSTAGCTISRILPKKSSYLSYLSASCLENWAIESQLDFESEPSKRYFPL